MQRWIRHGVGLVFLSAVGVAPSGCGGGDADLGPPDHGDPPWDGGTSGCQGDEDCDPGMLCVDQTCVADPCGNGVVDPGEQCDHGGDLPHHACAEDCTLLSPPSGDPIEAPDLEWTYVPIEGAICRDGSDTGIMVNLNADSDRVMIYMEGGGACFNGATCLINPDSFAGGFSSSSGVFDRDHPDNPLADWNFVYIPYCTGDVHAGDTENMADEELQQFRGYRNVTLAMDRVVPTFPDASQVLLTGISAGGFGAAANVEQIQRAFWFTDVVLLDDSGPPMDTDVIAPCLQDQWRTLWGFDHTILADCGSDCPNADGYVLDLAGHVARRFPDRMGGLFSNTEDFIIRAFYGYGLDDCDPFLPLIGAEAYTAGLMHFREYVADRSDNFGTYYLEGLGHTCIGPLTGDLGGECFYDTEVNGVPLTEWVADLLDGVATHVGP